MDLDEIVSELKKQRDALDKAIRVLERLCSGLRSSKSVSPRPIIAPTSQKRRKVLSEADRQRISQAMKKRWAERRAKVKPLRKSPKAA
jgi:hypothetical protein